MTRKQILNNLSVLNIELNNDLAEAVKSLNNFVDSSELTHYCIEEAIAYFDMAIAELEGLKTFAELLEEAKTCTQEH